MFGLPSPLLAQRQHVVGEGQSLARIARRYRVTVGALDAANKLERHANLKPGQVLVIPAPGVVYVRPGQTLARIARNNEVSVKALTRHNRLRPGAPLRIGQRLVLPGFEAAAELEAAEKRWGRPKRPGVVTFYRVWSQEKKRIRLLDSKGRVRRAAIRQLKHLLRPKNSRKRKAPHQRLVRLLAQISDHFGGRTINIISGYRLARGYTKESSRHVDAHAIDFRIRGVPTKVLLAYCKRFDHAGVGFYPKSNFVHLDVRRKSARWTDWAKPGQPPMRHRPNAKAPKSGSEKASYTPHAEDDGKPPIDDERQELSDE